jgi:hypothetical protein
VANTPGIKESTQRAKKIHWLYHRQQSMGAAVKKFYAAGSESNKYRD